MATPVPHQRSVMTIQELGPKPSRQPDLVSPLPTVYIVSGSRSMRTSLQGLVSGLGYAAKSFPDAESFLGQHRLRKHACLILDLNLPGMSGLDLLDRLQEADPELPVIALGEGYDVTLAVAAMRHGAIDYFEKPFSDHRLAVRVEETVV